MNIHLTDARPVTLAAGRELAWWARLGWRAVVTRPGHVAVGVAILWLLAGFVPTSVWVVGLAMAVALRAWAVRSPGSFARWVYGPVRGCLWCWWIRRHWIEVARGCGLVLSDNISRRIEDYFFEALSSDSLIGPLGAADRSVHAGSLGPASLA